MPSKICALCKMRPDFGTLLTKAYGAILGMVRYNEPVEKFTSNCERDEIASAFDAGKNIVEDLCWKLRHVWGWWGILPERAE